jgi:hypothetical protein
LQKIGTVFAKQENGGGSMAAFSRAHDLNLEKRQANRTGPDAEFLICRLIQL